MDSDTRKKYKRATNIKTQELWVIVGVWQNKFRVENVARVSITDW